MKRSRLAGVALGCQLLAVTARAQSACPSMDVNDVLNDPRVQEALDQAWADSLEGTPDEREEGAYIQQCFNVNAITGARSYFTVVLRWPHGTREHSAPSTPPVQTDTCRTVASFHTHPGPEREAPDGDGHDNPIPSDDDYMTAANEGLPGIIRWGRDGDTHDVTYTYGGGGSEPRDPGWFCPVKSPPARGYGDPHMQTLDGRAYDFMAIGDFVLMASPANDLEIHARLQPYASLRSAAVTTGIALRNRGDRIEWRLDGRQLIVNGVARQLDRGQTIRLRSFAVLRHDDEGFLFLSTRGDRLRVEFNSASVDYALSLARTRAGTVRGLFGNFDGDPDNDLRTATGDVIAHLPGEVPDHQKPLYQRFGESWRVAASASLFSTPYAPPAGVDVTTFPLPAPGTSDAERAKAAAACQAAGVTDAIVLEACVFDYARAGGAAFMASAARAERDIREGVPLAAGVEIAVDREVAGRFDGTTREAIYPIALGAGTYLFDGRGSHATTWRLEAPNGSDSLAGMNLMAANPRRVTLAGGRYRLRVAVVPESPSGRFRFRVRMPAAPETSALQANTRVSGRIDTPGQMRVFHLKLEPGRYDFLPKSDGELWWSLTGADGYERFDGNQRTFMERATGVEITTGGTYTLSVAGREWAGTGSFEVGFTRIP